MAVEDDLVRSMDALNRNITKIFGGTDSFTGARAGSAGAAVSNMSTLSRTAQNVARSLNDLKQSTDDFHRFSRRVAEFAGVSAIFDVIVDSGKQLVNSYTKLADVGQMFSGSMFNMAQAAGDSGLSLDEFTKAITRNSVAAAVMSRHSGDAAGAFIDIQKQVRYNLKDFGFYGMTLTQLTDATGDYIETLRLSGNLNKMNANQQALAVSNILSSATGFAAALGKSREDILKTSQEAMRDPLGMTGFLSPRAQAAASFATQLFAGAPGLSKAFVQIGGSALGTADMNIPFVKMLTSLGRGDLLQKFGSFVELAKRGEQISPAAGFAFQHQMAMLLHDPNFVKWLQSQANGPNRESAEQFANIIEQLQGVAGTLDQVDASVKAFNDSLKKSADPLTQAALLFESSFHMLSGAFDSSFFQGFVQAIGGDNPNSMKAVLDTLSNKEGTGALQVLGKSLGSLFGQVFTPSNIVAFSQGVTELFKFITDVMPDLISGLKTLFGWLKEAFMSTKGGLEHLGLSGGKSTLATLGLFWLGKNLLKNIFRMTTQTAYISVKNGIWAGGRGLLSSLFGGGGRGAGGAAGGLARRFGTFARSAFGGLASIFVDAISTAITAAMPAAIAALPIAVPAAIVAAIVGILKLGSDFENDKTRKEREEIRKQMGVTPPSQMKTNDLQQSHLDAFGRPVIAALDPKSFQGMSYSDLEKKKEEITKQLQDENKLAAIDPTDAPTLLEGIFNLMQDLKEINIAQLAVSKKTADNTSDNGGTPQFAANSNAF